MNSQNHCEIGESDMNIGAFLRATRTRQGKTLDVVASELKVQKNYISAIERLDKSALPSLGYVLGYVRSYAVSLGLDPADTLARFKHEIECPSHLGIGQYPHHVPKKSFRLPRGSFAFGSALACVLVVVSWYGLRPPTGVAKPTPAVAPLKTPVDIQAPEPTKNVADMIALKAIGPSFVEVSDKNGHVLISRIMVPGEMFEISRKLDPVLTLRDAGAIELYVAGERIGPIGQKGAIAKNISLADISE
ncbi:MAG TPA: helix-turn-helix domain-containing protein [Hellea balneolensis]|uniref:Helix-turn-helix domain-containing protein n=1 Tax=Hellea balneolensis TaxID=287478 RepID=A0A7C5R1G8_9PROT|nr:helix-turn-helix domain-containing protein [Hellea balneolensis]